MDSTMLFALRDLSATKSKATEQTYNNIVWLLNYAASHPTSVLRYKQSKMILRPPSDVSYLSVTKARIRLGSYHYLSNDSEYPPENVPIHNVFKIMTNIMALAAETEIGASFINAQDVVP